MLKYGAAPERLSRVSSVQTGRRVANFLLSWWNATECGGFDITDIWSVDDAIAADMAHDIRFAGRVPQLPG
jgi:hypothetical protein